MYRTRLARRVALAGLACVALNAHAAALAFSLPIHWNAGLDNAVPPHAVLTLPVDLLGRTCEMQLDTGANYRLRLRGDQRGPAVTTPLALGAMTIDAQVSEGLRKQLEQDGCPASIGTMGNGLFESGTMVIDLDHDRFSFQPGSRLGTEEGQPMRYVRPAGWEGGYVVVALEIEDRIYHAMLDTGAASFGFVPIDEGLWERLRVRLSEHAVVEKTGVKTATGSTRCARSGGGLQARIGNERFNLPLGYCDYRPALPIDHLDGVLGLAPFHSGVIVIDYVGQRWLHAAHWEQGAIFGENPAPGFALRSGRPTPEETP